MMLTHVPGAGAHTWTSRPVVASLSSPLRGTPAYLEPRSLNAAAPARSRHGTSSGAAGAGVAKTAAVLAASAATLAAACAPQRTHVRSGGRSRTKVASTSSSEASGGSSSSSTTTTASESADNYDVVVIGAGIGGLSAAALLAKQGLDVCVCEAHTHAGGAAHSFKRDGYDFDSGPSLLAGLATSCAQSSTNPLRHILNAIDQDVEEWIAYDGWQMITPDGTFDFRVGDPGGWKETLQRFGSDKDVLEQWERLQLALQPLTQAVTAFPAVALRSDLGAIATLGRYFPQFLDVLRIGPRAQAAFADVLREAGVTDVFLRRWFDYLCFVLQALPADGHQLAPVAFMMDSLYKPGQFLDYPKGGVGSLVQALVRGVEDCGRSKVLLNSPVEKILMEGGKAAGVQLRRGQRTIRARKAVISNASAWDTPRFFPDDVKAKLQDKWQEGGGEPEAAGSFLHLHIGFRANGLPKPGEPGALQLHYSVINSWAPIDGPGNVVIISIPSVVDPSLAPAGCHCLHAYVAASESYELWAGMDRSSPEYLQQKRERCAVLWKAVERIVPDVKQRVEVEMLGSPLTHERFLRRHRGTYGAYSRASTSIFAGPSLPGPATPIPGLLRCGDTTFPGIGVPSSAASGAAAATSLLSVEQHLDLMSNMAIPE